MYCCGPEPLLRAFEQRCTQLQSGALHIERFAPREQDAPVLTASFEIELSESGRTLAVPPDRSILEVVEEAGISVLSSSCVPQLMVESGTRLVGSSRSAARD